MSVFPVYQVGTQDWTTYGPDGFNEYGYNEQGVDRKGYKPIIVKEKFTTYFAQDDSYDAALDTRKYFQERVGIPWGSMLKFFFVAKYTGQRYPHYGHIVYAADTPNIRRLELETGNYAVVSGVDTSDWANGMYDWYI